MPLIELTRSQLMALRSLVAEHLTCPEATEVYIDVVAGGVETTPSELLAVLLQQEGG